MYRRPWNGKDTCFAYDLNLFCDTNLIQFGDLWIFKFDLLQLCSNLENCTGFWCVRRVVVMCILHSFCRQSSNSCNPVKLSSFFWIYIVYFCIDAVSQQPLTHTWFPLYLQNITSAYTCCLFIACFLSTLVLKLPWSLFNTVFDNADCFQGFVGAS